MPNPSDFTPGQIITVNLERTGKGLGFNIRGGVDRPVYSNEPDVFISAVRTSGNAHESGKVHIGDRVIRVNDVSIKGLTHEQAVEIFRQAEDRVVLELEKFACDIIETRIRNQRLTIAAGVAGCAVVVLCLAYRFSKSKHS